MVDACECGNEPSGSVKYGDFVFRRDGRVHLNRRGASILSTTGSRGVRISGINAEYTMFRGSVKSTDYPPHSPVSPSLSLPTSSCATTFQLESTVIELSLPRDSEVLFYFLIHLW